MGDELMSCRFRKKPIPLRAWQWFGETEDIPDWLSQHQNQICPTPDKLETGFFLECGAVLYLMTLEGIMTARVRDWIIEGIQGEIYPCKPDIFEATYEAVLGEDSNATRSAESVERDPATGGTARKASMLNDEPGMNIAPPTLSSSKATRPTEGPATVSVEGLVGEAQNAIIELVDGEWRLPCDIPNLLERMIGALSPPTEGK